MAGNFKKEDLRVIKTIKALREAFTLLLQRRKFGQITVNDLCEEALICRAAFYAHYKDKYHLLKEWMAYKVENDWKDVSANEIINKLIFQENKITRNIIVDADTETWDIVHDFFVSVLERGLIKVSKSKNRSEYLVLSNFCAGGLVRILMWQINNHYPKNMHHAKDFLFKVMESVGSIELE